MCVCVVVAYFYFAHFSFAFILLGLGLGVIDFQTIFVNIEDEEVSTAATSFFLSQCSGKCFIIVEVYVCLFVNIEGEEVSAVASFSLAQCSVSGVS
jgi:hypothetical protein